mgnify:CR=1 FL=1
MNAMKSICLYSTSFMILLTPLLANAEVLLEASAPIATVENSNEATAEITKTKKIADTEEIAKTKDNLPNVGKKIILKKKTKPTLKKRLSFNSFCGTNLTVVPPNSQFVINFAQNSAIKTFTYDHKHKSEQWFELGKCYSELGWKSFGNAMSRSGNNQSITDEKLFVSAKFDGKAEMLASNLIASTWKVMIPLIVRYEDETHYLEQHLKVKMVISIEKQQLAIDQVIASPALVKHKYEPSLDTLKTEKS